MTKRKPKSDKGFRVMDPALRKEIASKGGKAHSKEWLREIGSRGGKKRAEKLKNIKQAEEKDKESAA